VEMGGVPDSNSIHPLGADWLILQKKE
jgi:hypothetical protein